MNKFINFFYKKEQDLIHNIITICGIKFKTKKKFDIKNCQVNNFGIEIENDELAILANGPSLKDTFKDEKDYNFIKSKDIMVVNSFMLDEQFFILKPKYLCLMDPIYWSTDASERIKEVLNRNFEKLKEVNWQLIIFMPKTAIENNCLLKLLETNKNIIFNYINTENVPIKDKNILHCLYKENKTMPFVQNVLIACIYIAINLGYKNIFLYGTDHSWHLSLITREDNIPCLIDKHFYDKKETTEYQPIYKDSEDTIPFRISELFNAYGRVHEQYELLEDYSKVMGAKIYNLSKFSCIDAFDRNYNYEDEIDVK